MLADHIGRAGERTPPRYRADDFSLVGAGGKVLRLGNFYDEYRKAPARAGRELLRNVTRSWFRVEQEVPTDFEEARSDLLPLIRRRGTYECALLEQHGGGMRAVPSLVVEDFAVEVAYDWPECLVHLGEDALTKWDVKFGDALDVAADNLRVISREGLQEITPGFWISPWQDNYDASRILLPELIKRCEVQGSHVVMLPHQNLLLVTGSEDSEGLERMASLTEEAFSGSRFLSGIPLLWGSDGWSRFKLPRSHPLASRYQSLRHLTMASDYTRQGELLTALHGCQGIDIWAANVLIRREPELATMASWGKDVETILPETQYIVFSGLSQDGSGVILHAVGEWDRVWDVVGDLMQPLGLYPERYRVSSFPSPEQLEAIRGDVSALRNQWGVVESGEGPPLRLV